MEWLLFTYWLQPEPSRKRVFIWRQLKKNGALSMEGGWLLPRREPVSTSIAELKRTVEEMGGTANLYIVTHSDEAQEHRAIGRFQQEREREYSQIVIECHKALAHIEREYERREFNIEEVEELEGDLEKINRWFAEVNTRDFWGTPARKEVENMISQVAGGIASFTQRTYEETQSSQSEDGAPA